MGRAIVRRHSIRRNENRSRATRSLALSRGTVTHLTRSEKHDFRAPRVSPCAHCRFSAVRRPRIALLLRFSTRPPPSLPPRRNSLFPCQRGNADRHGPVDFRRMYYRFNLGPFIPSRSIYSPTVRAIQNGAYSSPSDCIVWIASRRVAFLQREAVSVIIALNAAELPLR